MGATCGCNELEANQKDEVKTSLGDLTAKNSTAPTVMNGKKSKTDASSMPYDVHADDNDY